MHNLCLALLVNPHRRSHLNISCLLRVTHLHGQTLRKSLQSTLEHLCFHRKRLRNAAAVAAGTTSLAIDGVDARVAAAAAAAAAGTADGGVAALNAVAEENRLLVDLWQPPAHRVMSVSILNKQIGEHLREVGIGTGLLLINHTWDQLNGVRLLSIFYHGDRREAALLGHQHKNYHHCVKPMRPVLGHTTSEVNVAKHM